MMRLRQMLSRLRTRWLQRTWGRDRAPLLIVGAPRTGSSFLVSALINGAGFSGSAEGHVTPLMVTLDLHVRGYYDQVRKLGLLDIADNTITKIPEALLRERLMGLFDRFNRDIFPFGSRLVDKTVNVEAISALPFMTKIWPGSKVICLTRDGVDNVVSAQKYFGVDLIEASRNWAACGNEWDRVAPYLPDGCAIVVNQNELTADPLAVATRVADHLCLAKHRRRGLLKYVMRYTPSWHANRARRAPLDSLNWSLSDQWTFLSICGKQMIAQGYATSEELSNALQRCAPASISLGADRVKVLRIDNDEYFRPIDDGYIALPGRIHACVLSYDNIATHGHRQFVGQFSLRDAAAQGVRLEIIIYDSKDGKLLGYEAVEIPARGMGRSSIVLEELCGEIDILIRLKIGKDSVTNDYAWVTFNGLSLV